MAAIDIQYRTGRELTAHRENDGVSDVLREPDSAGWQTGGSPSDECPDPDARASIASGHGRSNLCLGHVSSLEDTSHEDTDSRNAGAAPARACATTIGAARRGPRPGPQRYAKAPAGRAPMPRPARRGRGKADALQASACEPIYATPRGCADGASAAGDSTRIAAARVTREW